MAFRVEESVVIDRPRQEVWDYVIGHDDWRRPDVLEVRKLTDGPPGKGTRYEDTARVMGRELKTVNEVVRFDPPGYISWTQLGEDGPAQTIEGSYELETLGQRTRFTLSGEYEASGLFRLMVPLIRRQLQNDTFPRFLRQLKEILENRE